jgi:steroid 5-alpha reductase family enzyme
MDHKPYYKRCKHCRCVLGIGIPRHPNYFGESLMWWGIFVITLPVPYGIATIISPLVITYMLLKVSGVTLLESSLKEKRPEYALYIKTTSAFIPLPKKKF